MQFLRSGVSEILPAGQVHWKLPSVLVQSWLQPDMPWAHSSMSASAWWSGSNKLTGSDKLTGSNKLTGPQGSGHRDRFQVMGKGGVMLAYVEWGNARRLHHINTYCHVVHTILTGMRCWIVLFVCMTLCASVQGKINQSNFITIG